MSTGWFALVVHPETETARKVSEALGSAGFKVMAASSDDDALQRLGKFFVPDVVVTRLDDAEPEGSRVLAHLRANPLTRAIPVVVLATTDPDERRRSLRLGVTHLVPPPYDPEELVLTTRLALERHRDDRLLSGSLDQLGVTDLLQTAETARRTGTVVLRSRGRVATLWLQGGRIVDAEIDNGRRGKDAVYDLALWEEGTFEADFSPISVPERISERTSYLLLEAMRRRDEAGHRETPPPFAALPDPPPPPPRTLRAVHRALTLLNIAASYALEHLEAALLEQRLRLYHDRLATEHPLLARFTVESGGRVAAEPDLGVGTEVDADALVASVGRWLRELFADLERALPGRFSVRKLRSLTEAIQEDMQGLGFYDALGLDATTTKETTS